MEKVRLGIIGCGGIANGKHLPALKKIKEVELVAFCDIIVETKSLTVFTFAHLTMCMLRRLSPLWRQAAT